MKTLIFTTAAFALFSTLLIGIQGAWSDEEGRGWSENMAAMRYQSTGVAAASDPKYQEECGSCHFSYPPGLLPAVSWHRIMTGLSDHFGDNAELDVQTTEYLTRYLDLNAADRSQYRRSRAIMNNLRQTNMIPMRITEIPYFRHEHREIPQRIINLPEVGSLSQCNACHQYADRGSFSENEIWINGVGQWED